MHKEASTMKPPCTTTQPPVISQELRAETKRAGAANDRCRKEAKVADQRRKAGIANPIR
jgi:hypothetical protein